MGARVALITGGARIGQHVAQHVAGLGYDVAVTYRRSVDAAEQSVARIQSTGRRAWALRADLADAAVPEQLVDEVVSTCGGLDALIHMASTYQATPWDELDRQAWQQAMDTEVRSGVLLARAAATVMRSRGGGRVVFMSDWPAVSGRPRYVGFVPYYVSKHAMVGLTEALALELAPEILVNAVAPGPIVPPPEMSDDEQQRVIGATPLRRWGGPAAVAHAVAFLLTNDFITGECIRVDGGRHLY